MPWGRLGLQEDSHILACLGERAASGRSLGWHSWLPLFPITPSQGVLGESMPRPLPSRLRGFPVSLRLSHPAPQETHRLYRLKLEELTKLQNNCTSSITRQKKRLHELALILKKLGPLLPLPCPPGLPVSPWSWAGSGCLIWWGRELALAPWVSLGMPSPSRGCVCPPAPQVSSATLGGLLF